MIIKKQSGRLGGLVILLLLLFLSLTRSLFFGYQELWIEDFTLAMQGTEQEIAASSGALVMKHARIPRALIALFVGGALGVAGALIQTISANPMASPGIGGVNAGAAFALVGFLVFFPDTPLSALFPVALAGAFVSGLFVFVLSGGFKGAIKPENYVLAGAAVTYLTLALVQGMLAANSRTLEETLFWMTGSVEGRDITFLWKALPYIGTGTLAAWLLARSLNVYALGESVAAGLGQRVALVKSAVFLTVVLLSGASVAIAGPITLVGLLAPHMARGIVGIDHNWTLPYAFLIGAVLLLSADVSARFIIYPSQAPVGAVTAIVGAPFFVTLVLRMRSKR